MAEQARWYVVHTFSGYENKVATNLETMVENRGLQEWIHEVRVPTEMVSETKDGKTREVERKIFPGYVLVKMVMNDDSWFVVRNTRGCTGFVGPNGKPVPLTDAEVAALGVERRGVSIDYAVGDTVMITEGPLENYSGVVSAIDKEKGMVQVTISMLGRDTAVELELDQARRMD